MIQFNDWTLTAPAQVIARQYDDLSRTLLVSGDLPEGYSWELLVRQDDAMDVLPLTAMEGGVGVVLTAKHLGRAGYYQFQLRGKLGETVRHTNVILSYIPPSLSGDENWPELPALFTDLEQRLTEMTEHPPIPGADGCWMLWDTALDAYQASDIPLPSLAGASAYEVAVACGFSGSEREWVDSLKGEDGASVTHSWNGTVLAVTSASGTDYADLKGEQGAPGADGADGADGISPTVELSKSGGVTTLTVTDRIGTRSVEILDGADGSGGSAASAVPSYVTAEAERVAAAITDRQGGDTLTFLACSDLHHSTVHIYAEQMEESLLHCGQGMDAVRSRVQVDFAAMLGDMIWDSGETADEAMAAMKAVNAAIHSAFSGIPNFRVKGNHDQLPSSDTALTDGQVYAHVGLFNRGAVFDADNRTGGYCRLDLTDQAVRIIALNTSECADGSFALSAAQVAWLAEALAVEEGWGCIILSHHPLDWGGQSTAVMKALAAAADKIICTVHGHVHNFKVDNLTGTDIRRIAVPNASFYRSNEYGQNSGAENADGIEYGETVTYSKTAGTAGDTAFCVITVDLSDGTVYAACYGAGYDRTVEVDFTGGDSGDTGGTGDGGDTGDSGDTGGSFTNLVPSAYAYDLSGVFNGVGYMNGYYASTTAPYYQSTSDGSVVTGLIPYKTTGDGGTSSYTPSTIYIKGVTWDSTNSHNRMGLFNDQLECKGSPTPAVLADYFTITTLGEKYYRLEPIMNEDGTNVMAKAGWYYDYISISGNGDGADLIVTMDEPIE